MNRPLRDQQFLGFTQSLLSAQDRYLMSLRTETEWVCLNCGIKNEIGHDTRCRVCEGKDIGARE